MKLVVPTEPNCVEIELQVKSVEEVIRSCLFDILSEFEAMPVVWLAVSDCKATIFVLQHPTFHLRILCRRRSN